jgi:exopolyphosphatase/guanosine-5'-triphosphate,3'-diphosphate pyrophosphatase
MPRKRYRLAAIDIGTNSIHMIIVERQGRSYRIIDKEKEMVQLGRGSLGGEPLTPSAIERGVGALRTMADIARRWETNDIIAVATSAVREAPNRREFLRQVETAAGIKVRIISGEEEADYIYRALRATVDFRGGTAFCVDIGGGSVELIVGTDREVYFTRSEPLGALRMTQKFLESDPPQRDEILALRDHIRKTIRKPLARVTALGFDFCIGTSGTIMTLAGLASDGAGSDAAAASSLRWLPSAKVEELIVRLSGMSTRERVQEFAMDERRAGTIVGGAIVLQEILRALEIDRMRACAAAIREGIVERALEERSDRATASAGDVRRNAVLELAERSDVDRTHAAHVARLALRIFDQTAALHRLRGSERELLEYAALLHEVGLHVAYQQHHKHTYYLIRHSSLRGFTDDQVAIIANVARYYRKATPAQEHDNFSELTPAQRKTVERLAAILRLAAALDRGRKQAVRDVGVDLDEGSIRIRVRQRSDASLEMASARKRAKYMAELFEHEVTLVAEG